RPPCKSLKVTHNPINETDTFSNGDSVSGQVTLEVAKDCQISSLSVKFKGKARVLWSERHGNTTVVYHSKEKYFTFKNYFIRDKKATGDNVVAPGCHVYPFTFQIPYQIMPPSFKGADGKIVYSLEARLSRSMRIDQKDLTKINFVPNANWSPEHNLREPQHESKEKKMNLFTSGSVSMDVSLEKTGFCQGEGISVLACIQNNSSREIKPKYCLYRKHSFFAEGKRRVHTKDLLKEVGNPIPPSASEKVTRVITIPQDIEPSIFNCSIIKAEHRLRVYLDVKYASDPEIKFPIVILRAPTVSAAPPFPTASAPYPAAAFGFGNTALPQPPPAPPNPFDPAP
uniref:Zgc:110626 n=1 Tax=Tetraodon nigroviridis TaxID=99883 RepID=H3C002_TETNG